MILGAIEIRTVDRRAAAPLDGSNLTIASRPTSLVASLRSP